MVFHFAYATQKWNNYRDQGRLTFSAPLHQTPSRRVASLFAAWARDSKVSLLAGLISFKVSLFVFKACQIEKDVTHPRRFFPLVARDITDYYFSLKLSIYYVKICEHAEISSTAFWRNHVNTASLFLVSTWHVTVLWNRNVLYGLAISIAEATLLWTVTHRSPFAGFLQEYRRLNTGHCMCNGKLLIQTMRFDFKLHWWKLSYPFCLFGISQKPPHLIAWTSGWYLEVSNQMRLAAIIC